jgi:hypothetical protein
MKQCSKCLQVKPHSDFHRKKQIHDGYAYHCKACVREYDMKENDPKRILPRKEQNGLIHCRKCEQYLDKSKFWGQLTYCKDCSSLVGHSGNLKRFGLTVEDYIDLEKSQNNLCAICKNNEKYNRRLSVDHDHSCCSGSNSCGKCIRGLLCSLCNRTLGMVNDDVEILKAMIAYLEK